jgi:hypothetical protein
MTTNPDTLATLATVSTEVEAQLLANMLNDRGIAAVATGGFTSQFRAEAPGVVRVLVKQDDLSVARSVLAEREQERCSSEPVDEDREASVYEPRLNDYAPSATMNDQPKKPFQFSIAFLLWLTAVCAFVLGIAVWTPCILNPLLAAAIAAIIASAYRKGRRALCCSLIFGAAATAVAYGDWLVNVARFPNHREEHVISVSAALVFAIIGLVSGSWLAGLPSNYKKLSPPEKTEHPLS